MMQAAGMLTFGRAKEEAGDKAMPAGAYERSFVRVDRTTSDGSEVVRTYVRGY